MRLGTAIACVTLVGVGVLTGCSAGSGQDRAAPSEPRPSADGTLSPQDEADLDAQLSMVASAFALADPPQVDRIRLVGAVDAVQTTIDCLTAAGFPATLSDDGQGWKVETPAGQQEPFAIAAYTCAAQYPLDPAQGENRMTEAQKKIAYTYLTGTLVACLADHGRDIRGIPTEETFLGSWDTNRWNPYNQLGASGESLQKDCPANTPPELIWGS